MKKTLFWLGFLLIGLTLTLACSESDDSNSPPPDFGELIIGKWGYFQFGERTDGVAYMEYYESECEGEDENGEEIKDFLEFTEEGIFSDTIYNAECDFHTVEGVFSLENDILTVQTGGDHPIIKTVRIISLNSTLLKVTEEAEEGSGVDEYISVYKRIKEGE